MKTLSYAVTILLLGTASARAGNGRPEYVGMAVHEGLDLEAPAAQTEKPLFSPEAFTVLNIAPFQPGTEDRLAKEMVEYRDRTGNDVVLYSLTLNPEGYPAMKKAAYLIESYRKLRTALKGSGVRLGVLMQATLGHWPRVDKDEEPWMRSITIEGKTKRFCPLDPGYAAYIREVVTLLAKEEPCFLLIDDDVHASGSFGVECFCERHVARFNRENVTAYSPDALRAAVSASKPGDRLCRAFEKMQRDFVNDVVDAVRGALDAVDPKIPGGACMPYREHRYACGTARRMAAKGQPAVLRIDNSLYGHRTLTTFAGSVAYTLALTDYCRDLPYLLDESDSCPHNRWALSATLLDMKLQAAAFAGLKGSKLWYCNAHKGRFPISRAYTDRLAEHRGIHGALVRAVADAPLAGPIVPVTGGREAWHPSMSFENFVGDGDWATAMTARFGIPFACRCDLTADGLYLLGGKETVDKLTDDEIRCVLRRRALGDAPAAEALAARGFTKLIGVDVSKKGLRYNSERDLSDGSVYPFSKREETPLLTPVAKDAVVLTHLCYSPYGGSPDVEAVAPASVLSTNELSGRVIVTAFPAAGFPPWVAPWTDMRKDWLLRLLGRLGWDGWFALADQDLLLLERRPKDGSALLALFNTSFDPLDSVKLHAPASVAAVATLSADGVWKPVGWRQDENVLTVATPLACANALFIRITVKP